MAISPKDVYPPDQIDSGDLTNYPQGKAKNITAPGSTDGTPWERDIINDIFGFQQSILNFAGQTPNGSPESINNPQYLAALFQILGPSRYVFDTSGTWVRPFWFTAQRVLRIQIIGGGGGGGGGAVLAANNVAGGGGGSGTYRDLYIPAFELESDLTISIGPGGTGSVGGLGSSPVGGVGGTTIVEGTMFQQLVQLEAQGGRGGYGGQVGGGSLSGLGGDGWNGGGGGGQDAANAPGGRGGIGLNASGSRNSTTDGGRGGGELPVQRDAPTTPPTSTLSPVKFWSNSFGFGGSGSGTNASGGGGGGPGVDFGNDPPASLATAGANNGAANGGEQGAGAGGGGGGGAADRAESAGGNGGDGASGLVILTIL